MNFYSYEDIKGAHCCLRYAKEVLPSLGYAFKSGRIQARWRGGDGYNVAINDDGWYDHKTKEGGSVISLCALTQYGSDDEQNIQRAQDYLGNWLGLTPHITPHRKPVDHKDSPRYRELVAEGYVETAHYDYTDAEGKLCFTVYRLEHPHPSVTQKRKDFTQGTPFSHSIKDAPKHLYRLPEIAKSNWCVVVEGEKDADTLSAWGIPATTCNNGAANWRPEYTEELKGKDVVICRDNDEPGLTHARLVMNAIAKFAKSIRLVCPSSIHKGDVTDWRDREDGTAEKFRELIKAAAAVSPDDALMSESEFATNIAKEANKKPFANYTVEWKQGGDKKSHAVEHPIAVNQLVEEVHKRFLGFPKRIGDTSLFDHDRDTGRIEMIDGRDSLFAWIGQKSKHCVMWKSLDGAVAKGEFFASLVRAAERFEKTSSVPDYPARNDVYYTYRDTLHPTEGHSAFREMLSFFNPDGDVSSALLAAFFAAPMFFKPGIQRPCWIVDSHEARGVGKTTLVNRIADLYNCKPISTNRNELERDIQELMKRIVSVSGRDSRVLLLDNLKGVFDDPQWSDLVTTPSISGRPPYGRGEESRPNDLTFVITSNSANIGSDVASRSFMIYLKRPTQNADWASSVIRFINDRRYDILGDIYDILAHGSAPKDLKTYTRTPDFERSVVYPMCGSVSRFNTVMTAMLEYRDSANVDSELARDIVDEIIEAVTREAFPRFNRNTGIMFVRNNVINHALKNKRCDVQDVWNMINTDQIKCFHKEIKAFPGKNSDPLHGRGVLYIGPRAKSFSPFFVPIAKLTADKVLDAGSKESPRLCKRLQDEGWLDRPESAVDDDDDESVTVDLPF